jgi:hypothetical protein
MTGWEMTGLASQGNTEIRRKTSASLTSFELPGGVVSILLRFWRFSNAPETGFPHWGVRGLSVLHGTCRDSTSNYATTFFQSTSFPIHCSLIILWLVAHYIYIYIYIYNRSFTAELKRSKTIQYAATKFAISVLFCFFLLRITMYLLATSVST